MLCIILIRIETSINKFYIFPTYCYVYHLKYLHTPQYPRVAPHGCSNFTVKCLPLVLKAFLPNCFLKGLDCLVMSITCNFIKNIGASRGERNSYFYIINSIFIYFWLCNCPIFLFIKITPPLNSNKFTVFIPC